MTFQVGHSPLFIQGSTWAIENVIKTPLDSVTTDPAFTYINAFVLVFRMVIKLEKLFVKKKDRTSRKLGEDQFNIFRSLERSIAVTGVDGKSCLLRAICEMQQNSLNHYSIMGEIITALLTPKRGPGNMMHEYLEAERIGQSDRTSCSSAFPSCPVSLFNMLRTYSTPADRPPGHSHAHAASQTDRPFVGDGGQPDHSTSDDENLNGTETMSTLVVGNNHLGDDHSQFEN